MSDFFKQLEIRKAMSRWKWSYGVGYVWAVFTAVNGFVLEDEAGNTVFGFHPVYTTVLLILAFLIGFLARRLHKWLSTACMIALFVLALLEAVAVSMDDEPSQDMIFSWVFAFILFRGLLSVRTLKRFRNEMRQAQTSGKQREGSGQPEDGQLSSEAAPSASSEEVSS